jgi:hypothetical protein
MTSERRASRDDSDERLVLMPTTRLGSRNTPLNGRRPHNRRLVYRGPDNDVTGSASGASSRDSDADTGDDVRRRRQLLKTMPSCVEK